MREVVSLIVGIVMVLYALYFAIPMLNNERAATVGFINMTDPTINNSVTLGVGFYDALPFIPIIVGIFLLISYSLRRDPLE